MALPVDLVASVVAPFLSAAAAVWAGVKWFGEKAIDHSLERRMAAFTSDLEARRNANLAALEDRLRRETEDNLGESAAERSYRFEARKRLYTAVGPLRFQLVQAALQFQDRMASHANHPYPIRRSSYYGQSFLYRLGRLLAVTELIERQVAFYDFSVDAEMLRLVKFRKCLHDCLSDDQLVVGHPGVDWSAQKEHIYRDTTVTMAVSMLVDEAEKGVRAVRFDEFRALMAGDNYMEPLGSILSRLDPTATPLLWLRLCGIAALCNGLLKDDPVAVALGENNVDLDLLLARSGDAGLKTIDAGARLRKLQQTMAS